MNPELLSKWDLKPYLCSLVLVIEAAFARTEGKDSTMLAQTDQPTTVRLTLYLEEEETVVWFD